MFYPREVITVGSRPGTSHILPVRFAGVRSLP